MRSYTLILEQGEDGYLISEVLELPGCHTQAKTMDELLRRTKQAISLYLTENNDSSEQESHFIGMQKIEV